MFHLHFIKLIILYWWRENLITKNMFVSCFHNVPYLLIQLVLQALTLGCLGFA